MRSTRIAHISDLHFKSDDESDLLAWKRLRRCLIADSPDIVVVTGDLVNERGTASLRLAKRMLWELANDLGMPPVLSEDEEQGLAIVPGNHDLRRFGNLLHSKKAWTKVFGEFTERGFWLKERELVLYLFDSCYLHRGVLRSVPMARGRVSDLSLEAFAQWCGEHLAGPHSDHFWFANKLCALHHSPLPVAEAEEDSGADLSAFLGMDNGGRFLDALAKMRFPVALHGHLHVPQIAQFQLQRLEYSLPTVWAVAAGTASYPRKAPGCGYTYNMLNVARDGSMEVDQKVISGEQHRTKRSRPIVDWSDRLHQMRRNVADKTLMTFASIEKHVEIDHTGLARICIALEGGKPRKRNVKVERLSLRVPQAAPGTFRMEEFPIFADVQKGDESVWKKLEWKPYKVKAIPEPEQSNREMLNGYFDFPHAIEKSHAPVRIEIKYTIPNAFTCTVEQHKALYGHERGTERTEHISFPVDFVADRLTLRVTFRSGPVGGPDATHQLARRASCTLEPEMFVGRDAAPNAQLDESPWCLRMEGQQRLRGIESRAKPTFETPPLEDQPGNNDPYTMAVVVDQPVPMTRYFLKWNLPSWNHCLPADTEVTRALALGESARDALYARIQDVHLPLPQQLLGAYLDRVRKALFNQLSQVQNEPLEIGIAVFDPGTCRLRFGFGEFLAGWDPSKQVIVPGEGAIGQAFKTKRSIVWLKPWAEVDEDYEAGVLYRRPAGYDVDHQAIVAIPLLNPVDIDEQAAQGYKTPTSVLCRFEWRYVIGVLVLRSTTPATALSQLRDDDDANEEGTLFTKFIDPVIRDFATVELKRIV